MPTAYLALLRGINVGGKNMLPMKDLIEMFTNAGCADVKTFIQSGNVTFVASPKAAAKLPSLIGSQIAKRFGYKIPVVMRTELQLREALENNPYRKTGVAEGFLHVMFLSHRPAANLVSALDPHRSPPDRFIVRESEIFLHLPNGVGRTKLANAYFDSKLAVTSTSRNWRTATALLRQLQQNSS